MVKNNPELYWGRADAAGVEVLGRSDACPPERPRVTCPAATLDSPAPVAISAQSAPCVEIAGASGSCRLSADEWVRTGRWPRRQVVGASRHGDREVGVCYGFRNDLFLTLAPKLWAIPRVHLQDSREACEAHGNNIPSLPRL